MESCGRGSSYRQIGVAVLHTHVPEQDTVQDRKEACDCSSSFLSCMCLCEVIGRRPWRSHQDQGDRAARRHILCIWPELAG